jgi:hypothetical protein
MVHFFSSVAHDMFGYLEQKLLGRLVFLKSNFYVRDNFKFQCDPLSNKKDVSQRSNGACQKWHILFGDIFQRNLAHL